MTVNLPKDNEMNNGILLDGERVTNEIGPSYLSNAIVFSCATMLSAS